MTNFRDGDRVILSTQESRGLGTVITDSVIPGRLIVEWDAPCNHGEYCAEVGHKLTTLPLASALRHA